MTSVHRRLATLDSLDEINTYFAADPMVGKLRTVVDELRTLGDQVRAEELDGRIRAARQEAGRGLRDRLDLFADGAETIGWVGTGLREHPTGRCDGGAARRRWRPVTGTDYRAPVLDGSSATAVRISAVYESPHCKARSTWPRLMAAPRCGDGLGGRLQAASVEAET